MQSMQPDMSWCGVLAHHVHLALVLLLGEGQLGLPVLELRLLRAELRLIGVDARDIYGRIDLGDELARLDRRPGWD